MKPTLEQWYILSGTTDRYVKRALKLRADKGSYKNDIIFFFSSQHAAAVDIVVNSLLRQQRRWDTKRCKASTQYSFACREPVVCYGCGTTGTAACACSTASATTRRGTCSNASRHATTTGSSGSNATTNAESAGCCSASRCPTPCPTGCPSASASAKVAETFHFYWRKACNHIAALVGASQDAPGCNAPSAAGICSSGQYSGSLFKRLSANMVRYFKDREWWQHAFSRLGRVFYSSQAALPSTGSIRHCIQQASKAAANQQCAELCESFQRAAAVTERYGLPHPASHVFGRAEGHSSYQCGAGGSYELAARTTAGSKGRFHSVPITHPAVQLFQTKTHPWPLKWSHTNGAWHTHSGPPNRAKLFYAVLQL